MSKRRKISQRKTLTDSHIARVNVHKTSQGFVVRVTGGADENKTRESASFNSAGYREANKSNLVASKIIRDGFTTIDGSAATLTCPHTVKVSRNVRSILNRVHRESEKAFTYKLLADSDAIVLVFSLRGPSAEIMKLANMLPDYCRVQESRVHVSHRTEYHLRSRKFDKRSSPNDKLISDAKLADKECRDDYGNDLIRQSDSDGRFCGERPRPMTEYDKLLISQRKNR